MPHQLELVEVQRQSLRGENPGGRTQVAEVEHDAIRGVDLAAGGSERAIADENPYRTISQPAMSDWTRDRGLVEAARHRERERSNLHGLGAIGGATDPPG